MNELVAFSVLALSAALVVAPIVAAGRCGRLNGQFPWIFVAGAYLALNALGAFSPNVLDGRHAGTFYLLMLATSLTLALAFVLGDRVGERYPRDLQIVTLARGAFRDGERLRFAFVAILLCSIASTIVFTVVVSPPLLFRFDLYGDWAELIATRIATVKDSSFNWFALGFFELPLLALILSGVMAHITGRTGAASARFWLRARRIALIYALVTSVMFLHRHYLIYVLVAVFLLSVWGRGFNFTRAALFGLVVVTTIFALYSAYGGADVASTLAQTILHRAFEVYPWTGAEVVDVFTREQTLLNGRSMINLFGAFQFEQVDLAVQVYPRIYGNVGIGEAVGSAPVPAVFESYANFGWAGAIVTLLVLLVALVTLQFLWRSDDPWLVSLALFLAMKMALFWQSPLWFGFLEPSLVLLLCALVASYAAAPFRRRMRPA